ncbi:MAG: serine protease [Acidimicrobiia bacterium]|nr:serine protease [Acidimicrobiia bacterium]
MQDDDLPDDEPSAFNDPLHPDDRLWRHPSELRSVPPPGSRSIPDSIASATAGPPAQGGGRRRLPWGTVLASSLMGASAALLAVLVTGVGDRVVERTVEVPGADLSADTTLPVSTTAPVGDTAQVAASVMPSVAQLAVSADGSTTDGSAVVIRSDGYLLTDAHIVTGADRIVVTLADGTAVDGELVATDPVTRLAVVHIARTDLIAATFGDPAALRVGQLAMALGSHQGGRPSISSGVISALDERTAPDGEAPLYGLIRFDSPVPNGIFGGPLVTGDGAVVGVTTTAGAGSPFGWATPIDDANEIADSLIEHGRAHHAWLGIEGRRTAEGPTVMVVADGSPAAQAGIAVNDVLVQVDGTPISSMATIVSVIRDREPGDAITITYRRGDMEWDCVAVLGLRS